MWFALFRPQEWVWVDITGLHLSLVLGILLVVPSLATATFPNLTHPISIGMFLFLLSSLTAQIHAVNPAAWLGVGRLSVAPRCSYHCSPRHSWTLAADLC